jgi:hypothetical protein
LENLPDWIDVETVKDDELTLNENDVRLRITKFHPCQVFFCQLFFG